jgi:hypothetical protein
MQRCKNAKRCKEEQYLAALRLCVRLILRLLFIKAGKAPLRLARSIEAFLAWKSSTLSIFYLRVKGVQDLSWNCPN